MQGLNLTSLLVVFVVAILIAYIVGLTIVNTVDKHMNNVSINIPDLVLNIKDKLHTITTVPAPVSNATNNATNNIQLGIETFVSHKVKPTSIINMRYEDNFENLDDVTLKKNVEPICIRYHKHNPRISYGKDRCTYGRTNYDHPDDMQTLDKNIFKQFFQDNFTLQDYVNWLHLYVDNNSDLDYMHVRNLNKIMKGEKINIIPSSTIPANIKCFSENSTCYSKIFNENTDIR
jgi:hypothetical protein